MELGLNGKRAIVTGGGGAICGEIAKALAAEGVSVAIWDVSLAAGKAKLQELPPAHPAHLALACDVVDRESVRKVGWKSIRAGGPWDDEIMRAVVEDGVEVMKTLGLRDVDPQGGKKTRADYAADEPFLADYVAGIDRFLTRYGPGGTFFKDNPGVKPATKA